MSNLSRSKTARNYIGTNAPQPPNITFVDHRPTIYDRENYEVGDLWLYTDPTPGTNFQELWYLASLKGDGVLIGKKAKWVLLSDSQGGILQITTQDLNVVQPVLGNINLIGNATPPNLVSNITTASVNGSDTGEIRLNNSIFQPDTNASATEGMYALDGIDFMHNYGPNGGVDGNTFLGSDAGNRTLTGGASTGIGAFSLDGLTSGSFNTAVGYAALSNVSSGAANTAVGTQSLQLLTTGSGNAAFGRNSLDNATTAINNTAMGLSSLAALITGDRNTAIGAHALESATTAVRNTAVGESAAFDLVDGFDNVFIGKEAGSNYTATESGNIVIGAFNTGIAGEDFTTRIGVEGTQTLAYMAGINGVTIANPTPEYVVNVGTDGQLGAVHLVSDGSIAITQTVPGEINFRTTGGGGGGTNPFAFLAVQDSDAVNVTGDATVYSMGQAVALTEIFDVGNNFFPGDGAGTGCLFVAPVTGIYCFQFAYELTGTTAGGILGRISAGGRNWDNYFGFNHPRNEDIIINLAMGANVNFYIVGPTTAGIKDITVKATSNVAPTVANNVTYIYGYLLSEGASGGNFSQPFSAVQTTNSGNIAQGATYQLGSGVVLTELFDIGSNFYPGDGVGSPAVFTAPATGIFSFEFYAANTVANNLMVPSIATTARTYQVRVASGGVTPYSVIADMTLGDTATFELLMLTAGNTVVAGNSPGNPVYNVNSTRISGYRIA